MGAMENKGLNIFNSKLVLADSKTATDDELDRVEIEKKERMELLSFPANEIDLVDPKENEDHRSQQQEMVLGAFRGVGCCD